MCSAPTEWFVLGDTSRKGITEAKARINVTLLKSEIESLKRLSPSKSLHWAAPVFGPAAKLILAVGDLSLIGAFLSLGSEEVRRVVTQSVARPEQSHIGKDAEMRNQ